MTNAQLVDFMYVNTLHRLPDSEGRAYWVQQLETGKLTLGGLLLYFFQSSEHYQLLIADITNGIALIETGASRKAALPTFAADVGSPLPSGDIPSDAFSASTTEPMWPSNTESITFGDWRTLETMHAYWFSACRAGHVCLPCLHACRRRADGQGPTQGPATAVARPTEPPPGPLSPSQLHTAPRPRRGRRGTR